VSEVKRLKVLFCWTNISGYMAACWRALSARPEFDVFVCAYEPGELAPFSRETMTGLSFRLLDTAERFDVSAWTKVIDEQKPDILVNVGWGNKSMRALYKEAHDRGIRTVLTMDTPYWAKLRQLAAPYLLASAFNHADMIVGTGERTWQYAYRLRRGGRAPIKRGLYGIDFDQFEQAHHQRQASAEWPQSFLFVGRYAAEKGLDVLLEAYRRYREAASEPWELKLCGTGKDASIRAMIDAAEGVVDLGFQQPDDLPSIMAESGAFVLGSLYDPWPLVIVEACASGLPILCTEACGSAVENVRPFYNGLTVETGDVDSMLNGLLQVHAHEAELPQWGARSLDFARPYSAENWAIRWGQWVQEIL
jgi:glycosyltransferase involved in cell wall biosynthesis